MNTLKLTINPYEELNTVSLDDRAISPYSELANYLRQPLLNWADKLCGILDREINDYYSLITVGEDFDALFLGDLAHSGEFCKSAARLRFLFASPVEKRFAVVSSLADKYSLAISREEYKVKVSLDGEFTFDRSYVNEVGIDEAFILVTRDPALASNSARMASPCISLLLSSDERVTPLGNSRYVWEIKEENFEYVISAIVDRFAKIPYIVRAAGEIVRLASVSESDRQLAELSVSVCPVVEIGEVGRIEVGKAVKLPVKVIPENLDSPAIRIAVQNEDIIKADGVSIMAIAPGVSFIEVFKGDDIVPLCRRRIETFRDKSVKSIILDRPEPNMGIGRTQKIDIQVRPIDADDASFIIWSTDRPDIASVDDQGNVTAKSAGRVRVTASTRNVKESVIIDVLPNISAVDLSLHEVKLMRGESMPIGVTCAPAVCFKNSCTWTTDNSNVAYVETYSDGTCVIRTKEIGECNLVCTADEGGAYDSCHVTVLDPVEEEKKRKKAIDIACIIGIPAALIALFLLIALLFG